MNPDAISREGAAAAMAPQRWWGPRKAALDYEISTRRCVARTTVCVSGNPTLEQLVSALHVFGIESGAAVRETMLIDLRRLEAVYARADLLRIGHEIACSFAHLDQLALLVQPHRVTRISERAARRAGMNMRVFDSEQLAVSWLQLHAGAAARARGLN
ncbi:MAG: hypothetical protein AB7P37_11200 [Ramlibacter sp.]